MVRGQLKIQEMAFVLLAIVIFLALVGLVVFSFRLQGLRATGESRADEQAQSLLQGIIALPELQGTCQTCLDFDKARALQIQNRSLAKEWQLDYLMIERSSGIGACTAGTYPNCKELTLIAGSQYGRALRTFASICYWDAEHEHERCDLGSVYASGKVLHE